MELQSFPMFSVNGTSQELLACTARTELLSIPWRKPLLQQADWRIRTHTAEGLKASWEKVQNARCLVCEDKTVL
jgi:hypothetical protein